MNWGIGVSSCVVALSNASTGPPAGASFCAQLLQCAGQCRRSAHERTEEEACAAVGSVTSASRPRTPEAPIIAGAGAAVMGTAGPAAGRADGTIPASMLGVREPACHIDRKDRLLHLAPSRLHAPNATRCFAAKIVSDDAAQSSITIRSYPTRTPMQCIQTLRTSDTVLWRRLFIDICLCHAKAGLKVCQDLRLFFIALLHDATRVAIQQRSRHRAASAGWPVQRRSILHLFGSNPFACNKSRHADTAHAAWGAPSFARPLRSCVSAQLASRSV